MPIDVLTPQSPGWWLDRLYKKLIDPKRQARLAVLDGWSTGNPPLPEGAHAAREAYTQFQRLARSNFAELMVEAVRERMTVIGFRTSAEDDVTGDEEAWRIWRRAGMPVESAEVLRTMLRLGDSYVITGPPDPGSDIPVITSEDPRQVVTEHDPRQQRKILAGLKLFHDDVNHQDLAYLFLPGQVYVASRSTPPNIYTPQAVTFSPQSYDWDTELSMAVPGNMMPLVRFRNAEGVGEFESHLDLLGRINHGILQRMTIAVFQAFRQRAVKNLPKYDESGEEIDYDDLFRSDPGAFWQVDEAVEFWESQQVDLTPILSAIRADVEHLAAVSRTPMHYLAPGSENQSAEGAALAREGLVFRVYDRMARVEDGWAQVMSNAFLWTGETERADLDKLEVIWDPPERYSLSERLDAATKAQSVGVPFRTIMIDILGFPPHRVDQMEAERTDDALLQAATLAQGAVTPDPNATQQSPQGGQATQNAPAQTGAPRAAKAV